MNPDEKCVRIMTCACRDQKEVHNESKTPWTFLRDAETSGRCPDRLDFRGHQKRHS
ncbi:hypothetical cytosolic protein [Syntrophus aciditrophicus SB]|uniref:Hypothetical cytosolic protein n=1 Tax=Syntrophus aciditrophicus (strain SB) TaxID=56780 RepID=Q2LUQ8_SYNAS|nr:hypothetical cytosolic protein [Syntrophus aciditrophicus SB]